MKNKLIFSILISLISASVFGQSAQTPILGFNDNRDLHIQAYIGMGYSFYKMKNEEEITELLESQNFNVDKPEGSISYNLGLAFVLTNPEIRFLADYRSDHYSNGSSSKSIFSIGEDAIRKGYEVDHQISTISLGIEKILFLSEEKIGYVGLGGSYLWIFDSREEKDNYKYFSQEISISNTLDISGKALEIHFSIGAMASHKFFAEGRVGYQFNSSFEIENPSKLPGRSSQDFQANFNTYTFKFVFGFVI